MEMRLVIAYGLIALMVLSATAMIGYRTYYSRARVYERRLRKEADDYAASRTDDAGST